MGVFVIAAYRPKKGKERLLRDVLKDHLPILRKERLLTDRPPYLMRAADGTFVEVFESKSPPRPRRPMAIPRSNRCGPDLRKRAPTSRSSI